MTFILPSFFLLRALSEVLVVVMVVAMFMVWKKRKKDGEKSSPRLFINTCQVLQSSRENEGGPPLCSKHNAPQKWSWKPEVPFYVVRAAIGPSPLPQLGVEGPNTRQPLLRRGPRGSLSKGQRAGTPHTARWGLRWQEAVVVNLTTHLKPSASQGSPQLQPDPRHTQELRLKRNSPPKGYLHTLPFSSTSSRAQGGWTRGTISNWEPETWPPWPIIAAGIMQTLSFKSHQECS